jgi:hypothetical protein
MGRLLLIIYFEQIRALKAGFRLYAYSWNINIRHLAPPYPYGQGGIIGLSQCND